MVETAKIPHHRRMVNEAAIEPQAEQEHEWPIGELAPEKSNFDIPLQLQRVWKVKNDIRLPFFDLAELSARCVRVAQLKRLDQSEEEVRDSVRKHLTGG